jgi:hypothetical protein
MAKTKDQLAAEIATTLRGIIHVPPLEGNILMAHPDFWDRCTLINPNWRAEPTAPAAKTRIYVDGHMGGCKFNAWNVFNSGLEEGIRLYQGYAFAYGSWAEHAWCMLGSRIIETTGEFTIYYGAELTSEERAFMKIGCDAYEPLAHSDEFWTVHSGDRVRGKYHEDNGAEAMFRERHPMSRELLDGLGRW